ncbi:MAG: hypothetical protein AAGJ93_11620, partial [Bacteroidota bacterium]
MHKQFTFFLILLLYIQNSFGQNLDWGVAYNSESSNDFIVMDIDRLGDLYVATNFEDTLRFMNGEEQITLVSRGNYDFVLLKYSSNQELYWYQHIGGLGEDKVTDVKVGEGNHVYWTGIYTVENIVDVDFDTGPDEYFIGGAWHQHFILKMDTEGNVIWGQSSDIVNYALGDFVLPESIAIDNENNVLICGYFKGDVDFDPSISEAFHESIGDEDKDAFVCKYNSDGDYLWSKSIGNFADQEYRRIATDHKGDIYLSGSFGYELDFNPADDESFILTPAGGIDPFIQKLNKEGELLWAKSWGGIDSEYILDFDLDYAGNIYTTGYFQQSCDFDPSEEEFILTANLGTWDGYIQKLNTDGELVWVNQIGGLFSERFEAIEVDSSGNQYVTGYFGGQELDFDAGDDNYPLIGTNAFNYFLLKQNNLGTLEWATTVEVEDPFDSNTGHGKSLAVDAVENIYTGGLFKSTLDFDPS